MAETRTSGQLRMELKSELAELRTDNANLRGELRAGLHELKSSLLMWLIPLLSAQLLAVLALLLNLTLIPTARTPDASSRGAWRRLTRWIGGWTPTTGGRG